MRGKYKIQTVWLWIIGSFTVAFAIVLVCRMTSPIICELATAKLQSEINKISNRTVIDYIDSHPEVKDIVSIDRNDKGEIRGITADTVKVNKMKSNISIDIQKELDKMDEIEIGFPLSGFIGFGGGIKIPVQFIGAGIMKTELNTSFDSVGVNQTRLRIDAVIHIEGKLLTLGQGQKVSIKTEVPVLMSVIVGNVPSTYVDVKK